MSINNTLARPYAKAAFEAAVEHRAIEAWAALLRNAMWVVKQDKLKRVLTDPTYTQEQRYQVMVDIMESLLTPEGRNFFKLLADNDRLALLPAIYELFERLRSEQEKIAKVEVNSASPLTNSERQQLKEALEVRLQREVILDCSVDPSLIGGMIIRAGDLVIDSSVHGKLARLSASLLEM